jgi:cysteinyl-tRNA synthetase
MGHARVFVSADIIRRYLEYRGYEVSHVQNFTDVDDKIIARAQIDGITPAEAAKRYSDSYFEVMDQLNVLRAHQYPTVTGSMTAIIDYVHGLIERGYAYEADGDVYFEVDKFEAYGQLSGRTEDEGQMVGVRKELEPGKHDPRDFALWKRAKPGEPSWPSPWGEGRPGWHIECSAMVRETLGNQIDIHGGGRDLIFPHHENELAQSEAYTDVHPFVRYWAHAGLVTTGTEKMAHSLENFTTIADVLGVYEPVAVRLFLLQTHYRSSILYSREGLDNAVKALDRLRGALEGFEPTAAPEPMPAWAQDAQAAFERAMDDDFNTPGALGTLFDLVREINRRRAAGESSGEVAAGQRTLRSLAAVIGLELDPPTDTGDSRSEDAGPFIELLLTTRQRLREAKQWALADEIRNQLRDLGVLVEDRPDGAVWRRERPAGVR